MTPRHQPRFAMRLSLAAGLLMLAGKFTAYLLTGSAAILSDAGESVVHVVAVGFAAFSLWLSGRPANQRFLYGYERITFFSAGFEGAMIVLAALFIMGAAIHKWLAGLPLQRLGLGTILVAMAAAANAALGWYLIRVGRRHHSLILEANGKHVLTDSWTSFGIVGGLILVILTGWKPFDPLLAIAVALNILWSGSRLVLRSIGGLMDYASPETMGTIQAKLDEVCGRLGLQYHAVRFRNTGHRVLVELHLLFPYDTPLGKAHRLATELERQLPRELGFPAEVITHLESLEDHGELHPEEE
ncbi:MAG: cation diffusion facilitator family transporter [Bryobacteraceae bacterium]